MATFLLIHGAWHGGWCWKKATPLLREASHQVFTPTLTGLGERSHLAHPLIGLETHVRDLAQVLTYENLSEVILVGHSSAGTLITAVAERVPERIAHLVYLDGFVPQDGQSTMDLINFLREPWEARVRAEGYGWLLPSLQPVPWDDFVRDAWGRERRGRPTLDGGATRPYAVQDIHRPGAAHRSCCRGATAYLHPLSAMAQSHARSLCR
jgi:pimeloyl-ACP methyl ester carboxylesterase